jgi:hypothetical protein
MTFNGLLGVIPQKAEFFITTAVKTSHLEIQMHGNAMNGDDRALPALVGFGPKLMLTAPRYKYYMSYI